MKPDPDTTTAARFATRRRVPVQERSRARVEAILAAARELVVERGSDAMTMTDIAARAGVPISSLYQYFPDKPAILRELVAQFMELVQAGVADSMQGVRTKREGVQRIDQLLAAYFELFFDAPDVGDLWSATQSDRLLQQLDIEDTYVNSAAIYAGLRHLASGARRRQLKSFAFLAVHLTGAVARLALAVDRKHGDQLMQEYRKLVRHHLDELLDD